MMMLLVLGGLGRAEDALHHAHFQRRGSRPCSRTAEVVESHAGFC